VATTRSSGPATDALLAISDEDGDGSGYLTRAEISVAARTYFTSTDPESEATTRTAPAA
jgi:hypothetical protein